MGGGGSRSVISLEEWGRRWEHPRDGGVLGL